MAAVGADEVATDSAQRSASETARRTGTRVEVIGHRSATGSDYANPDGSFTHQEYARPVRVRRGNSWVPVDTQLTRQSAAVVPGATSVPVTFSDGGTTPLATVGGGAWSATLGWSAALPRPRLAGDTATYPDVLPGVDLVVTATDSGFAQRLVVRTRAAAANPALRQISLKLGLRGLTAVRSGGGLALRDGTGQQLLTVPQPMMWDAGIGSGGNARQARVGLDLVGDTLTLRPDLGMLADPATRFPVTIDPSFNANRLDWTGVESGWPNVSYWNGANLASDPNGRMLVGLDPYYGDIARGFFRMNTSAVNGKHILKATFQITEKWSYSCTATPIELWQTGAINSGITWNNQPSWTQRLATVNAAHGNEGVGCGDGSVEFDATGIVRSAAAGNWSDLTLGLRASNEGDVSGWKRFDENPSLAIDYNSVPNTPGTLTIDNKSCGTGTWLGTRTPTMRARVSDPDAGQTQTVSLYWAAKGAGISETNKVTQTNVANGGTAVMAIPAGKLADGGSYYFQVKSGDGTDTSALSTQCDFNVDTTAPGTPGVTSSDYPSADGNVHGGVGITGAFVLTGSSDATSFWYGWADPPTKAAQATGGSATISATPLAPLLNTLYVRAVDRAGNLSAIQRYTFLAGHGSPPAGEWAMIEGAGGSLADQSSGGHPVTLSTGTSWTSDRSMTAGHAVHFDGSSSAYGTTTSAVVRTNQSFSVAAWVRLTNKSGWATAVTQQGTTAGVMTLQYDPASDRWAFTNMAADAMTPHVLRIESPAAAKLNVWTHLAGTYDAGAGTFALYVNGVKVATGSGQLTWNATGPFAIGAEWYNGHRTSAFEGDIADVQVWDRLISDADVLAAIGPAFAVGQWDLSADGTDGSGRDHVATATGGTTFLPAAAHNGFDGAASFDGTGDLETAGPVVLTDQSYSVSAWVKLNETGGFRTAVCQQGSRTCAFFLQYDKDDNRWSFTLHGGDVDNPAATYVTSTTVPAVGVWTHLVGVYDAAKGTASLYVNGSKQNSKAVGSVFAATGPVSIGRAKFNGGAVDAWRGQIDHAAVWLGALTDQQVVELAAS